MEVAEMYRGHGGSGAGLVPVIQVLSLVLLFSLPTLWGAKVFTSTPERYDRVTVKAGDTVWSLVARRSASADDLGEAVFQVSQLNHLQPDAKLQPGRVLLLPKI
jgi:predicted Zn-dependent protease